MPALSVTTSVNEWRATTLGESCIMYQPKTITRKEMNADGKFPVYGANGVIGRHNEYNHDDPELVIGCRGSIGMVHITEPKSWINGNAMVIQSKNGDISQSFLRYLFLGGIDISSAISGTAQPQITRKSLSLVEFSYPPLDEQQRIVSILDEAFEWITESVEQIRLNLINANEQFSSILQSIFTVDDDGWNESPLIQVVEETCTLSYGIVQPGNETIGGIPVVRPTDLSQDFISTDGLKRIEPSRVDSYSRTELVGGEILLCVRGSAGKISIANQELKGANVTRGIVPIRFDLSKISQKFGYYLLLSEYLQLQIREKTYGSTLQQINIRDVKQLVVRYPSLNRQATILLKLESLFTETKNLSLNYERKYENIIALKQSILHEAFNGTL